MWLGSNNAPRALICAGGVSHELIALLPLGKTAANRAAIGVDVKELAKGCKRFERLWTFGGRASNTEISPDVQKSSSRRYIVGCSDHGSRITGLGSLRSLRSLRYCTASLAPANGP